MRVQDIAYVALFAAMTAVLGLAGTIYPLGVSVPITAQSMGAMLAGSILGSKRGAASQILFLLLVAAGLPLLAGGRGGLGIFATPSVGFFIGWPIAAFFIGIIVERLWPKVNFITFASLNVIGGIFIIYLCGIPFLMLLANLSLLQAAAAVGAYVPGDLIKAVLAAYIAMFVKRGYPLIATDLSAREGR